MSSRSRPHHYSNTPLLHLIFFRDFPAPGENFRLCARSFGFLDVAGAIVKQRETGPADLIVRLELHCFLSRFDCLRKTANLHQCHSQRVPAVEKAWVELDAAPVLLDRAFQLPNGEVAIGIVKNFVAGFHLCCRSEPPIHTN
jgi:hypothetical protein